MDCYAEPTDEKRAEEGLPPRESPKADPVPDEKPEPEPQHEEEPEEEEESTEAEDAATERFFEEITSRYQRGSKSYANLDAFQKSHTIGGKPMTDAHIEAIVDYILKNPEVGSCSIDQIARVVFPNAVKKGRVAASLRAALRRVPSVAFQGLGLVAIGWVLLAPVVRVFHESSPPTRVGLMEGMRNLAGNGLPLGERLFNLLLLALLTGWVLGWLLVLCKGGCGLLFPKSEEKVARVLQTPMHWIQPVMKYALWGVGALLVIRVLAGLLGWAPPSPPGEPWEYDGRP